ncbi:uncharacterized protein LOC135220767 isoform X2 [Macrobrachium nipponense]|uniref:uncharacterized protein LOC135220767 isoform X2 n=1 Tax=Macrobrachium nipponense TaxID=159736 RepID=UPI0030C7A46D
MMDAESTKRLLMTLLVVRVTSDLISGSKDDVRFLTTEGEECRPDNRTIFLSASLVIDFIDSFKDSYTSNRLGVTWEVADIIFPDTENDHLPICNHEEQCFDVLPNITEGHHDPPTSEEDLELTLIQTLSFSQRYSTALESLIMDEIFYDETFTEQMNEAKLNMDNLSAELEIAVLKCGLLPDEKLIQDLISKTYLGVASRDVRAQRGFRSLRQCLIGMWYIRDMFPVNEEPNQSDSASFIGCEKLD